jgi:hypothetical protein
MASRAATARQAAHEAAEARAAILLAKGRVDAARATVDATLAPAAPPQSYDLLAKARLQRLGARIRLLAGDAAAAERLATEALEAARQVARDPRHSADVGEAAWLRAQARAALGRAAEAASDTALAHEALQRGLGADRLETTVRLLRASVQHPPAGMHVPAIAGE